MAESERDTERGEAAEEATRPEGVETETEAPEDAGAPEGEATGQPEPEPEDELARVTRERAEFLELAQRTQADFENFRKRAARDAAAAGERSKAGLVRELLSVVDNLERALAAAEQGDANLRQGVELVHGEIVGVLQRSGIESFDPRGEPFDPTLHEALSTRSEEGAGPGVVLDVVEKGYSMNGNVLRPARVVVSG